MDERVVRLKQQVQTLLQDLLTSLALGAKDGPEVWEVLSAFQKLPWPRELLPWRDFWPLLVEYWQSPHWEEVVEAVRQYWQHLEEATPARAVVADLRKLLESSEQSTTFSRSVPLAPEDAEVEKSLPGESVNLEECFVQICLQLLEIQNEELCRQWKHFLSQVFPQGAGRWRWGVVASVEDVPYLLPVPSDGTFRIYEEEPPSGGHLHDLRPFLPTCGGGFWLEEITPRYIQNWACPGQIKGLSWYLSCPLPSCLKRPPFESYGLLGRESWAWEISWELVSKNGRN